MDFVLLAVVLIFVVKGFCKGFANIFFSLISTILVVCVAYKFCEALSQVLQNVVGLNFEGLISNILDKISTQKFGSVEEVQSFLGQQAFIGSLLLKILGNVAVDGELSLAQIFSPTINQLLFKTLAFVLLYVFGVILAKIVLSLLNKLLRKIKLGGVNRWLGAVVGMVKGMLIFAIIYVVVLNIGNLFLNENIINFCQNGAVSTFIYNNFTEKILSLFY